jgi:hypothetical protein
MTKKSTDKELADTLILNGERVSMADMKRFWKERPDPDFDPKHNEDVIKRSIARAEKHRRDMQKLQREGLAERTNALASYIKYLDRGGSKDVEGYFGKRQLAELQGKKVMTILQKRMANGKPLWKTVEVDD